MPTVILTPSHLAGAVITATVNGGVPYHITDRPHPTEGGVIAVGTADCTTTEMTVRQTVVFRAALPPAPESWHVDMALARSRRKAGCPCYPIRVDEETAARLTERGVDLERLAYEAAWQ